jgi:fatty-acyl-CoA synthase
VPQTTLPECLELAARRYPGKPAIVYCGSELRYAQLQERVAAMAAYLREDLNCSAATACWSPARTARSS